MTNRIAIAVAAALVLSAPAWALEQKSTGKADRAFLTELASANLMEVELGRITETHASSERVKEFGRRMVEDHQKAMDEVKSVATRLSVTLPASMTKAHRDKVNRLSKLHGQAFDRAFMQDMVKDHEEDVAKVRRETQSATDPDVKDLATKLLPTLESHLEMAKDISAGMSKATAGTRAHRR